MSISTHYGSNVNKSSNLLGTKVLNVNIKNTTMYPTTINGAVKMLSYKNIAPAPTATEYKPIAPAPVDVGVKARKYTPRANNTPPYSVDQTQSVQRRNARERNRVKQVNNSFARLRQHLPQYIVSDMTKGGGRGPHKKISKVDTLRIAVEYIRRLEYLVEDLGGNECFGTGSESTDNSNNVTASSTPTMQSQRYYATSHSPQLELQHQQIPLQQSSHQQQQQQQQQQSFSSTLLTPVSIASFSPVQTKIDTTCHSPTASYISNTSFDSGTYEPPQQLSPEGYSDATGDLATRRSSNLALKFEPYENFRLDEEDCTPDDDEIIDYISLWQEEQQASQN